MEDHNASDLTEYPIYNEHFSLGAHRLTSGQFDYLLSHGWRFLGGVGVRHSFSTHFGHQVLTIPGRIRLEGFTFSKSQRKLLRKGFGALRIEIAHKAVNDSDNRLFHLHAERFMHNVPAQLRDMVSFQRDMPQRGYTVRVYKDDIHVATSFFHLGEKTMDSTYCVYDPNPIYAPYSLGNLTLLVEIQHAMELGMTYYYVGYRYSLPSHFDYKANFNNLERFDHFIRWVPTPRIPLRPYDEDVYLNGGSL